MTRSQIFFWKFDKSRDLIQSKLSYVDVKLESDLGWICKSPVKRLVYAFQNAEPWMLTLKMTAVANFLKIKKSRQ